MSYAATVALQEAVYAALVGDTQVALLSEGEIYDALPPGPVPPSAHDQDPALFNLDGRGIAVERAPPAQHFVEQRAKGEDVPSLVAR